MNWRTLRTIGSLLLALLVALPIVIIMLQLFSGGDSSTWDHLRRTVLKDYVLNTLMLLVGTGIGTLVLGVGAAWVVSIHDFWGRKFFQWALILPLSIPTYIAAFTYSGLMDYTGPIQSFTRNTLGWKTDVLIPFEIMSMPGAILVLSVVLYPYVFLISRALFMLQSRNLLEASWLLGHSPLSTFFRVALPVARPAIIGGLSLVIMEVLNDYGAVKYYGISTFTTGIFRAWFSLGDLPAAIRLSAYLLLFVLALLMLERWQRGRQRYADAGRSKPLRRMKVSPTGQLWCWLICGIPFLLGFLLPVGQLLQWAGEAFSDFDWGTFAEDGRHTFFLAFMVALAAVLISLLLTFSVRQKISPFFQQLISRLSTIGYAVPGAVIAIGVMVSLGFIDRSIGSGRLLLLGSMFALVYACVVRFLAVAFNSVDAGYEKIGANLSMASTLLGASPLKTLTRIHIPLLTPSLLAALILVFIDVLKELPLTLILRPFNFDTLATRAFELASDEQLPESAIYALSIILLGLIPVVFLNKLMKGE